MLGVTRGFHTAMGGCCQNPKAASCGGVVEARALAGQVLALSNISALWDQSEDAERGQAVGDLSEGDFPSLPFSGS